MRLSLQSLARAYGDDEAEYSRDQIKEANPEYRMKEAETEYKPIRHDHKAFLRKANRRSGFQEAYQALAVEYEVASEMLATRTRAGLTPNLNKA